MRPDAGGFADLAVPGRTPTFGTRTHEVPRPDHRLLGPITITYDVEPPEGDPAADEVFRAVALRVHERHCTVSRSLEKGTEVHVELPE